MQQESKPMLVDPKVDLLSELVTLSDRMDAMAHNDMGHLTLVQAGLFHRAHRSINLLIACVFEQAKQESKPHEARANHRTGCAKESKPALQPLRK
jgi:hypothetical protein